LGDRSEIVLLRLIGWALACLDGDFISEDGLPYEQWGTFRCESIQLLDTAKATWEKYKRCLLLSVRF